jgi:hypothetical protein
VACAVAHSRRCGQRTLQWGKGNGEVVSTIQTTPYSLGYAVNADVLEAGLPFATMKNKVLIVVHCHLTRPPMQLIEWSSLPRCSNTDPCSPRRGTT